MSFAIQLLSSPSDLLGGAPTMWDERSGWRLSFSTNPAIPDFTTYSNSAYVMSVISNNILPQVFPNQAVRIIFLDDSVPVRNTSTSLASRTGTLSFGLRDSSASSAEGSIVIYNGGGTSTEADFGSVKMLSATNYESAINGNVPKRGLPDILTLYY